MEYFSFDAFNIGMVTNGQAYFHRYASHVWTTMYNERCANTIFFQTSIDDSRELMIAQLIFSERNKLDEVKNKVIRISKKKK